MLNNHAKRGFRFHFTLFVVVFAVNIYLLAIFHQFFLIIIVFFSFLLFSFGLMYAWDSPFPKSKDINIRTRIFMSFFSNNSQKKFTIQNGRIDGNYFLLHKKPRDFFLAIDNRSAAVCSSPTNQSWPLLRGNHFIVGADQVTQIFHIGLNFFTLGPLAHERKLPAERTSAESLADYHLRVARSTQTRTTTKDQSVISPTFNIIYRLDKKFHAMDFKMHLLEISKTLAERDVSGEVNSYLDQKLAEIILHAWKNLVRQHNLDQLKENFGATPKILNELLTTQIIETNPILSFLDVKIILETVS